MTQLILNIEDASIIPRLKQILNALKGVSVCDVESVEGELNVVAESIETGYRQAKNKQFAVTEVYQFSFNYFYELVIQYLHLVIKE